MDLLQKYSKSHVLSPWGSVEKGIKYHFITKVHKGLFKYPL
jgi:hypothetical protein